MQKINTGAGLREAIILLEIKRAEEEKALREHLHVAYESMRPINIIKSVYKEVAVSENLKDELINTSTGLVIGYASKTLFESVSHSPIRKLLGTAILFGITNLVRKNPDAVKSVAGSLFKVIRSGVKAATNRSGAAESSSQVVIIKEK